MLYKVVAIFCSFSTRDSGSPLCQTTPPPNQEILEIPAELYIYRYRMNGIVEQAMQYCLEEVNDNYGYVVLRTDTWEI